MSKAGTRPTPSLSPRRPLTRIILARGENIRAFTVRPWVATAVGLAFCLIGIIYLAATAYLFFRDDLFTASIARQLRLQQAYEDSIASLRAEVDRLTSRNLLSQEAVETKLERLLGRQAALDQRQDVLARLSQTARRAGIVPAAEATSEPVKLRSSGEDAARSRALTTGGIELDRPRATLAAAMIRGGSADEAPAMLDGAAKMKLAESSLEALSRDQLAFVEEMAATVSERTAQIGDALKGLAGDLPASGRAEGVGGPFVPLVVPSDPEAFRFSVALVAEEIERFATMRELADRLPLMRPIAGGVVSSGFGTRLDPFLGKPAFHQGVDFQATDGYPIRATAGGKVVSADYSGGYGNLIEIDNGNGITTRFAHLSRMLVKPGQRIGKGALIGRAGTTGRSTGPHLHYEVRLRGQPVDPMRYIGAWRKIAPLL